MKSFIIILAIILCAFSAQAADVSVTWQWEQGDGAAADGFIVYFSDGTTTWNKTIRDGSARQWVTPEETFPPGVELSFWGTAYCAWAESAESARVAWTREGEPYTPPDDNLPQPTTININGPVQINIGQ